MVEAKDGLMRVVFYIVGIFFMVFNGGHVQADAVDVFIEKKMEVKHIPGLQLAIIENGKLVKLSNYGHLDIEKTVDVQTDTLFPINSMTKAFTGTLIVKLASQNKLTLSDPIGKHLDNLPSSWQSITIQQVLSHASGLPSILTGNVIELVGDGSDASAWEEVKKLPMQSESDLAFNYNQTGYVILGKIIEKYSGKNFSETIQELLIEIGMTDTAKNSFGMPATQQYFYANDIHQSMALNFPPILWPAAGMSSNAQDLAKFVVALQTHKVFDATHLNTLWTPHRLSSGSTAGFNDNENGYAAGWQVITRKSNSAVSASGGNAVTLIVYPQDNLSIIVLTNLLGSLPIEFVDEIAALYH